MYAIIGWRYIVRYRSCNNQALLGTYNRQTYSANCNAVSCGTSQQGILRPEVKYPAEIQPWPIHNLCAVRSANVP